MLIFLIGAGSLSFFQVMSMEDQWDEITQNIDKMDVQVKRGLHEKAKFFAIARDVVLLAPTDPNANQVAVYYKLKQLQQAEPELMSLNAPSDTTLTNSAPEQSSTVTNGAPAQATALTNAAPGQTSIPVVK
jgi:hypothetical protein